MRAARLLFSTGFGLVLSLGGMPALAQQSDGVKALMGKAEADAQRRAVEDLINKLQHKGAAQKSPPVAPPTPTPIPGANAGPSPAPVEAQKRDTPQPAVQPAATEQKPGAAAQPTVVEQKPAPTPQPPAQPPAPAQAELNKTVPASMKQEQAAPVEKAAPPVATPPAATPPQPVQAAPAVKPPAPSLPPGEAATAKTVPPPSPPAPAAAPSPPAPVKQAKEAPPPPKKAVPASAPAIDRAPAIAQKQKLPSVDIEILFDSASARLTPKARESLVLLGRTLSDPRLAESTFVIGGYTDSIGAPDYNLWLSQLRADTVRSFLITEFNIDPKRLIAKGYGKSQFKNAKNTAADENRRVTVINWTSQLQP